MVMEKADLRGRLLQVIGAASEKAIYTLDFKCECGTLKSNWFDDLGAEYGKRRSEIYSGSPSSGKHLL